MKIRNVIVIFFIILFSFILPNLSERKARRLAHRDTAVQLEGLVMPTVHAFNADAIDQLTRWCDSEIAYWEGLWYPLDIDDHVASDALQRLRRCQMRLSSKQKKRNSLVESGRGYEESGAGRFSGQ